MQRTQPPRIKWIRILGPREGQACDYDRYRFALLPLLALFLVCSSIGCSTWKPISPSVPISYPDGTVFGHVLITEFGNGQIELWSAYVYADTLVGCTQPTGNGDLSDEPFTSSGKSRFAEDCQVAIPLTFVNSIEKQQTGSIGGLEKVSLVIVLLGVALPLILPD